MGPPKHVKLLWDGGRDCKGRWLPRKTWPKACFTTRDGSQATPKSGRIYTRCAPRGLTLCRAISKLFGTSNAAARIFTVRPAKVFTPGATVAISSLYGFVLMFPVVVAILGVTLLHFGFWTFLLSHWR